MCACEEHTANNTCPEPFELVGILGIAETLGYHIVKDQHHFVVEERLIKLNDIRLADFILVLAVDLMKCLTLAEQQQEKIQIMLYHKELQQMQ